MTHPYIRKKLLWSVLPETNYTLGKAYLTIKTDEFKLKHAFYVIRDDTPIEHDGILGIDFLNEHAVCNFPKSEIKIGNTIFKLHSQRTVTLKPRSETIIQAVTRRNRTGIVHAEEHVPGVYIGNCLVEAKDYTCPISMINTTDKEICIPPPRVKIEKVEDDNSTEMYAIQTEKNIKSKASRKERIWQLLRTQHLNSEEDLAIKRICEEYCDTFHLEGEPLSYTTAVEHTINTRTDASPVNVRPYRLPEKHKTEVNR